MNNYIRCIIAATAIMVLAPGSAFFAQKPIFGVKEFFRNSGKVDTIDAPGLAIIDINSTIKIYPDKDAIQQKAIEFTGQSAALKALQARSEYIQNALKDQARVVELINEAIANPNAPLDELANLLVTLTGQFNADSLVQQDFNNFLVEFYGTGEPGGDPLLFALERFNQQLDSLARSIANLKKTDKIRFSIAAFRLDKSGGGRLHVENFDHFENGEFFVVDNWVMSFSPEQIQQFEQYADLANSLNENAGKTIENVKQQILRQLPSLNCLKLIPGQIESLAQTLPADLQTLLQQGTAEVQIELRQLESDLLQLTPGQTFDIDKRFNALLVRLDTIRIRAQQQFAGMESSAEILSIRTCLEQAVADAQKINGFVKSIPANYLRKVWLASDKLSDEIEAFDLDQIPPVGILDLSQSGRREVNDEVCIRAYFRLQDDTLNGKKNQRTIEERTLKMVQVGAHTTTKIGMFFADHYLEETPPDVSPFRFAPSGALLMKFGSRRSHFYNNFLDPGIGVNLASLDFNRDGTPELTGGVIGTFFRDIISVGWNWNFGENTPLYFVGIHLPFNLPGFAF